MIVRRHLILVFTIVVGLWVEPGSTKGERWSRQVLNSEWIPLANPRSLQGTGNLQLIGNQGQFQQLSLPPTLRDQYHQQLLQLQETQESIQKLLQLQQQLRAQQQLLQAQSYIPEGFSSEEERKAALHQSTIANIQTLPHIAPGALLPPPPGDQPQLPEFGAQDFLLPNAQKLVQIPPELQGSQGQSAQAYNVNSEEEELKGAGDKNQDNTSTRINHQEKSRDYATRQGGHFKNPKQPRENENGEQFSETTQSSINSQNDGEEEVQLLYVPAETLAQRDQQQKTQRGRSRKQHSSRQQQQESNRQQTRYQQQQPILQQSEEFQNQGLEGTRPSAAQQTFAHQVLYQLQEEQAKRTRQQQEDREKEISRLRDEQNELERQAKLHQERVFREQDARRQKELALRKELERQEEDARQKELQRLRELKQRKQQQQQEEEELLRKKEAERQEELERQKISEIIEQERKEKEAESRQAEIDRLAALERQKELEIQQSLKQQQELERQQAEDEARSRSQLEAHRLAHQDAIEKQRQAQIDAAKIDAENRARNQAQQQHLTETITRPKSLRQKSRPRQRNHNTTPSPNQPPLSVYMGSTSPVVNPEDLKVSDVLTILKDAKTISVLDSVGPNSPQVFVGPSNLAPPNGYAKFDLPYLSAIDNNRVERKVDKLPFFVAPLSFKPPPGYSKIPFPAPHIGSVVINNLDNEADSLDGPPGGAIKEDEQLRVDIDPLIEPNSYTPSGINLPTSNQYNVQQATLTPQYNSQEAFVSSTTPRYEASYSTTPSPPSSPSSSGSRYRHRQFYNDRTSPHVVSTALYEDHSATEPGILTRSKFRQYFREEQGHVAPTSLAQTNYRKPEKNYSAGNGEEETVVQDYRDHVDPQAQVNSGAYNNGGSQGVRSEFGGTENGEGESVTSSGPTQYTIASELPRISPHLPGLVNSLLEQQELVQNTTPAIIPTTTTTTTTTTERSTTTNRSRGRQRGRIVPTRAPTTTEYTPTRSSSVNDRAKRPYSRSRVRQGYATTTETYKEAIYEPTKSMLSGVEEKTHYSTTATETQRRPANRNQRYRGRGSDRNAAQPEARPDAALSEVDHNNPHNVEEGSNANNPAQRHSIPGVEQNIPVQNINAPVYNDEVFLSSVNPSQQNNENNDNVRPNAQALQSGGIQEIQGLNYHQGFKTSNFGQSNVEERPVNGFNYQSQTVSEVSPIQSQQQYSVDSFNGQRPQNAEQIYSFHGIQAGDSPGKPSANNFQNADLNVDQIYTSNPQGIEHSVSNTNSDNLKIPGQGQRSDSQDVPDLDDLRNEFLQTTTETPPAETTTSRPILQTPAPLNIRQRVRSRLNQNSQRPHVDAAIQTRPTGSRDEFVRFSAVNQDSVKQHSSNPGRNHQANTRAQRPRYRGQVNQVNIQTEGNDYVRIQTPTQKPITTTTTTTIQPPANYPEDDNQDIEYGFIRPPSFKPIHPVAHAAPTFRPKYEQVQTDEATNDSPVEIKSPQQSQTLKNRSKYHLMNRRPLTRSTIAPTLIITSTESPINDEVYTVRSKTRNEDIETPKLTRGRVRRPGKRRTTTTSTTTTTTTTTTESILDSNNELPIDENYPQIIQGLPASSDSQRQTLFDEELKSSDLETLPKPVALQRPAVQLHSFHHQENSQFPRQDFVLNFGIGSDDRGEAHEEYDQTQLASSPQLRKYSNINRGAIQSDAVPDVEGAESQWSTKLTHSSFQPISSLHNHVQENESKNKDRQEKSDDGFDIITARPADHDSVDVVVTANNSNAPRDIVVNTSYLGSQKKEGSDAEKAVLQGRSIVVEKNDTVQDDSTSLLDGLQFWKNRGTTAGSNVFQEFFNPVINAQKSSEIDEEPSPTTKRTVQRRRRVRIRVRPTEDFVSAESQHVSSAWNNLVNEKSSYDKLNRNFNEFKIETPTSTAAPTTSTTEETTVKSFFEQLLNTMTNNDDDISTTTDVSDDPEPTIFTKIHDDDTKTSEAGSTGFDFTTTNAGDLQTMISENSEVKTADAEKGDNSYSSKSQVKNDERIKLTESNFEGKKLHKNWWNRKEEEEPETITSKPVLKSEELFTTASEVETTIIPVEDKESASEHNISDYVEAFFKGIEENDSIDPEEDKPEEINSTTELIHSKIEEDIKKEDGMSLKNVEKNASSLIESTTTFVAEDLTRSKNVEEVTTPSSINQELITSNSAIPKTTPEVPLSPEELTTTEIPLTTTTTTTGVPKEIKTNNNNNNNPNDLSKILRTSTTTEISHMTEICYRGRCVKTKSRKEVRRR